MLSRNCFEIEAFRSSMPKEQIEIDGAKTYGPYSPGVKSNGMIWLAGQIALESGDDIKSQTRGCLIKIDTLLSAAGVTKNNICFVQVLLADINDFDSMNEEYTEWLKGIEIPPARAAFEAGNLPKAARIEIVVQATE